MPASLFVNARTLLLLLEINLLIRDIKKSSVKTEDFLYELAAEPEDVEKIEAGSVIETESILAELVNRFSSVGIFALESSHLRVYRV